MQKELKQVGITKPFIYPELDKVSEYLKEEYKHAISSRNAHSNQE